MTYGLQVFDAIGNVTFDSTLAHGGVVAEVFAATGAGFTKTYPLFPGRSALALSLDGASVPGSTVDYALGYPRVSLAPSGFSFNIAVLVL